MLDCFFFTVPGHQAEVYVNPRVLQLRAAWVEPNTRSYLHTRHICLKPNVWDGNHEKPDILLIDIDIDIDIEPLHDL